MKKTLANEIAKHLKKVAKNTTDETAFVVNIKESIQQDDYYIELLPDYKRRTQDGHEQVRMRGFYHMKEVVAVEHYHKVCAVISAMQATYEDKEYDICRVMIFTQL